jgi:hypothetical protein
VHWFWIVPLVLLIVFLASPRFRGDIAETRVRRILAARLEKSRYTVLNDVIIPSNGGTVQIDHLIVSKFGIFVIESQYARGWVSGGEFQDRWKQYRLRRFTRFDNPMHRNALQLQALESLLKVPASKLHPIVVLLGQKGFKTPMPSNLLQPVKLISYIRKKAHQLLDAEQANRIYKAIEDARIRPDTRMYLSKWTLLRFILLIALIAGAYLAFRDDIADIQKEYAQQKEKKSSPGMFHPDGSRKSEQELWEDSLVCAYSSDSGRCACYEPGGSMADIAPAKCRSLAERGSILKQ